MAVTALQQANNYVWAQTVLTDAGLPTTPGNVGFMVRWMTMENEPAAWFRRNNPLNINSQGLGADTFASLDEGAQKTAAYLSTMSNYTPVFKALSNNDQAGASLAIIVGPWAESHYEVAPYSAAYDAAHGTHPEPGRTTNYVNTLPAPPTVSAAGQTIAPGSASTLADAQASTLSAADTRLCGTGDPGGIDIFGAHIGTKCQRKALIGALLIGAGGAVMVIGVFVLVGKSSSVRGAAGAVVGGIAGGPAGAATGAKVGAATAPAPAPAPKSQSERNAERVAALPPEVREDARRRRVESGLQPA